MRLGITGHRGLPPGTERLVREALTTEIRRLNGPELVGVSCIADGPDAWFAQSVLEQGGRLEVVVPAQKYRDQLPAWHHSVYDGLLRQAAEVYRTGRTESDSQSHMTGSELLVGLVDQLLAVWDGAPARGYGGTADVIAYAEQQGVPVQVVWPPGASRD